MSVFNTIISLMGYSGLYFLCLQIELARALSCFLCHEKINSYIFRNNWWRNLNSVNFSNNSQQQHSKFTRATFQQFVVRIYFKRKAKTIQTIYRLSIMILWGSLEGKPIVWFVPGFPIYLLPITSVARDWANKEYLHKLKPACLGVLGRKVYKFMLVFPGNN